MRVPLGFWRPEPGESPEEFDERVLTEMTAAIASVKSGSETAGPDDAPDVAPESGGAA